MDTKENEKQQIKKLYLEEDMSRKDVAKKMNLSIGQIKRRLQKYNIKKLKKEISFDELYNLYIEKNLTQKEVSEEINVSKRTVERKLKEYDINKTSEDINKTKQKTCLKNYGVKNPSQSSSISDKKSKTCLKNYGVKNPSQSSLVLKRKKETWKKKYGVDHPFKSKDIQKKAKQTLRKNYNVEHPSQIEGIQKKIKIKKEKTCLEKYGEKCVLNVPNIKKKIQKTIEEKYGVDNVSKNPEIKIKIQRKKKETNLRKYGVTNFHQKDIKNFKIWSDSSLFKDWVINFKDKNNRKLITKDIIDFFNVSESVVYKKIRDANLERFYNYQESFFEKQIELFFKRNNIKYKKNNRKIIYPLELDFIIEKDNQIFAVEMNDTASHNCTNTFYGNPPKPKKYHLNKTELCKKKNVFLIHIFEKDLDKLDLILQPLLDKKVTGASKLKYINNINLEDFLNENHRQGAGKKIYGNALVNRQTNEILACMTFSKVRNKSNGKYELNRYCVKKGWVIKFGAERLFKNWIKEQKENNILKHNDIIISYCDRTYNVCKIYERLGFKFSHNSEPNYKWVKNNEWHSRESCQRHKLSKKFNKKEYENKQYTENNIMTKEGFVKIYDCGNSIFQYVV